MSPGMQTYWRRHWRRYWDPVISGLDATLKNAANPKREIRMYIWNLGDSSGPREKLPRDFTWREYWEAAKRGGRGWSEAKRLGITIEYETGAHGRGVEFVTFRR
jgi:hypothetical protein